MQKDAYAIAWTSFYIGHMAARRGPKGPMSESHKAALARGRAEGRAVRRYLDALRSNKPKRGRKRTPESIRKRLAALENELQDADALTELRLIQERRDLQTELESMDTGVDLEELEREFIEVAGSYSERQGISYASWREIGVPASVLKQAGISRSS